MNIFISSRISKNWLDKLSQYFDHLDHYEWSEKGLLSPEDFRDRAMNAHVIITESDMISNETLIGNKNLFLIADFRGTVINIDVNLATELGIVIMNTPGRNADAVADLTIAFMIMASRKVIPAIKAMEAGLWTKEGKYWMYTTHQGYDLPGKTVGLIGLGAIGKLVAERLRGFKTRVIGFDPYVDEEQIEKFGIELVSKDDVFRLSDFISLHVPLNNETKGIFGLNELSLMKQSAYLINTSRAAVFIESELIGFLQSGKIAGAAIDVYHTEPLDADYPLFHIPNVICTPHIGGATLDVVNHQCEIGVNSLIQFLEGSTPGNIINPAALEKSREKMRQFKTN
jgi:phosphoglycerate dehydrogenase-like enzyme